MALQKVTYVNGETVITAENLNEIQDAIIALEDETSITIDSALSATSTNPVQNKVINQALGQKANTSAVPTKTSDLTNDSGFVNASGAAAAAPVQSVNGQTGAVTVDEVYWATYNVTTYADIKAAYDAGKVVMLKNSVFNLPLLQIDATSALFSANSRFNAFTATVTSANVWTSSSSFLVDWDTYEGDVGDKTDLTTSTKTNLVAAINELNAGKLDNNLGSSEAGKFLVVGSDGIITAEQHHEEVTVSTAGAVTQALDAGKLYHFTGALTALTITLNVAPSGQLAQYHFDFNCGSTAPTVTIPSTVTMPDSFAVEANKHYEVDILNNYGAVVSWANS